MQNDHWLELLYGPAFLVNSAGDVVGSNRAGRIPVGLQQVSHVDSFEQLRPNQRLAMIARAPSNVRLRGTLLSMQKADDDEHIVFRMYAEASPFSWIGQEARQHLHSIQGLSAILGDTELSLHQERLVEGIAENTKALFDGLGNLGDLERLRSRQFSSTSAIFQVSALVDKVRYSVQQLPALGGIQVTHSIASDLAPWVVVDGERVRQVLLLLIENGIAAATNAVHVDVSATETELHFAVSDDGEGVPPVDQAHLFLPFRQKGPGGFSRGTGFGLLLAKSLLQEMGGRIWYDPSDIRGSTFHFTLPNIDVTDQKQMTLPELRCRDLRIVIAGVDDDENHALMQRCLLAGCYCGRVDSIADLETLLKEGVQQGRPFHLVLLGLADDEVQDIELGNQLVSIFQGLKVLNVSRPLLGLDAFWAAVFLACERVPQTVRPSPWNHRVLTANERVLLVDSSASRRWLVQRVLQDTGIEVDAVDSSDAALKEFNEVRHAILVVDTRLQCDENNLLQVLVETAKKWSPSYETRFIGLGEQVPNVPSDTPFMPTPITRQAVLDVIDAVQQPQQENWSKTLEFHLGALTRAVAADEWENASELLDATRHRISPDTQRRMRDALSKHDATEASRMVARLRADLGRSQKMEPHHTKRITGELHKGAATTVEELIPAYLKERHEDLQMLNKALLGLDFDVVQQIAHRIAGTGTTFGFPELTQLGHALKDASEQENAASLQTLVGSLRLFLTTRGFPDQGE